MEIIKLDTIIKELWDISSLENREDNIIWTAYYIFENKYMNDGYDEQYYYWMRLMQRLLKCPDDLYEGYVLYVIGSIDEGYLSKYREYVSRLDYDTRVGLEEYINNEMN